MIYLFHGSDVEKARTKAFEWVAKARHKEPNLAYVRFSREDLSDSVLEDVALSGGLFVKRLLILIDDPFPAARTTSEDGEEKGVAASILEEHINSLAASDNAVIILAPKLGSAKAKKIAAKAKAEYKYDKLDVSEGVRGWNANLVNALALRSREKLWLEINRALRAGDSPEMLHGILHWKTRNLMEKGGRAWTREELRQLSLSLIFILQESRLGRLNLRLSLERFSLLV